MPRLFFALWPDDDTRKQLQLVMQSIPRIRGKAVQPENLHITLAFLGPVDDEMVDGLEVAAMQIKARGFELKLDTIGWWRKAGILWMAPAVIPEELDLLVARVNEVSKECGIALDGRPYKPHLTLARKAVLANHQIQDLSVNWQVKDFALVQSITHHSGAQYSVRRSYSLLS